jgi:hypothetical protein
MGSALLHAVSSRHAQSTIKVAVFIALLFISKTYPYNNICHILYAIHRLLYISAHMCATFYNQKNCAFWAFVP